MRSMSTPEPTVSAEEASARLVYSNPTSGHAPAPAPARSPDLARDLYPHMYGRSTLAELADAAEPDDPDARADVAGLGGTFQDMGLNTANVELLASATRGARTADEATRTAWRAEAEKSMREQYGTRYVSVMRDAQTLVHRDPVLCGLLDGGAGDHPRVVALLVDAGQRARAAGKIR